MLRAMRLLLDMDGPLAAFDKACFEVCQREGVEMDIEALEQQTARFFTEHMPTEEDKEWLRFLIDEPGWFEDLEVTEGASDGVNQLVEAGVDIWVCTKPLESNPTCRDGKAAWLRKHFPDLEHKLILAPDKSLVRGDVLLDDAPVHSQIEVAEWDAVVFSLPFNGAGSVWESLPHWSWGDDLEVLIDHLKGPRL